VLRCARIVLVLLLELVLRAGAEDADLEGQAADREGVAVRERRVGDLLTAHLHPDGAAEVEQRHRAVFLDVEDRVQVRQLGGVDREHRAGAAPDGDAGLGELRRLEQRGPTTDLQDDGGGVAGHGWLLER
jgi:hypothetical protein